MVISELTEETRPAWDSYVQSSPHGLPQHLSGWRAVLRQVHGYETHYLMAWQGEQVVGVLPLFLVRSLLVGRQATTMPGGLCAGDEMVAGALLERGREIAGQARAGQLALHDTRQPWNGLPAMTGHVYWVVDVRPGAEALWSQLDGNVRRQVRLARQHGLQVVIDRTGRLVGPFYDVLSRFTHQAGTPLFGREFLDSVVETFPGDFNIAVVYLEEQPVGAYFQLQMGRTVYGVWGATLRQYLPLRPVYLAYWEIIADTAANGYHFLDMGRSPAGSTTAHFKGQWGGQCHPIYQQVVPVHPGRAARSMAAQVQADGRFQLVRQLWPRLPFSLACYLGPKLRRHIPFA
ncbi:MAG: GNAT family N-acetyltransferase [Chloroflexi bacterium]|nr:GNAT family N-acetyltransferase [Chloroflexota bacterium]MCI0579827.1 GNAT family N-acetyltransferase [Chloroflexota bacterium]MCI0646753.1 GNAT family N-acetyltransferase [Chloroflexota bacterium]MCI0728976.1 GNAT family N-acetyltransferase [Chloroflexota bacterium]